MISKWLEDMTDTLLYLVLLMGLLFFFCFHWKEEYQVRYAELVMETFLSSVSAEGKITLENYEGLVKNLDRAAPGYEIKVVYTEYMQQPIYAQIPKSELEQYYMSRNVRKDTMIPLYATKVEEEEAEALFLQAETNATVLAAEQMEYLPLPEEGASILVEAVRPYQEAYEGEKLVTLCRVCSMAGNYYMAAETAYATDSGMVMLELTIDGEIYMVPIEVICYPRRVLCNNGHEIVNSRKVLEKMKETGQIWCPYCRMLPESMVCNVTLLKKKTGTELTEKELWLTVRFLDGHTELITPESDEWWDNYDKDYCGTQQVILSYRGMETVITVISENDFCMQCGDSCNERSFIDYNEFSYCIGCMSQVPLFTGNVKEVECNINNNQLVAILDEEGVYYLCSGAYVTLYLYKDKECRSILQNKVRKDGK